MRYGRSPEKLPIKSPRSAVWCVWNDFSSPLRRRRLRVDQLLVQALHEELVVL
jgi:hypothetical protein